MNSSEQNIPTPVPQPQGEDGPVQQPEAGGCQGSRMREDGPGGSAGQAEDGGRPEALAGEGGEAPCGPEGPAAPCETDGPGGTGDGLPGDGPGGDGAPCGPEGGYAALETGGNCGLAAEGGSGAVGDSAAAAGAGGGCGPGGAHGGYGPIGGSGSSGAAPAWGGAPSADGGGFQGGSGWAGGGREAPDGRRDAGPGASSCAYDGYAYGRNPRHHNIDLGRRGEDAACAFLERKGFEILARNYRCAAGEADIIAEYWEGCCREVHFIEVKTRTSTFNGFPEEAVDAKKRDRYERISEIYLSNFGRGEARITFDIITILVTGEHSAYLRMHSNVLANDCAGR